MHLVVSLVSTDLEGSAVKEVIFATLTKSGKKILGFPELDFIQYRNIHHVIMAKKIDK